VVDYFINNFGVVLAGLMEVLLIAWFFKELNGLQSHANGVSDIQIGSWWKVCISFVTPVVLGYMMFDNIRQNLKQNYENYPTSLILFAGLFVVGATIVIAILLSIKGWKSSANTAGKKEVA